MSFVTNLKWDQDSQRLYETGVRRGVLFLANDDGTYQHGIAWNGLTSVQETPSGAEANPIYADDMKYLDIRSAEEFGATIQAYTYPKAFEYCDGSASLLGNVADFVTIGQQARRKFAFSYATKVGNDVQLNDYSYKIHIIYGCTASPSEREYQTVNDNPEAISFSWEVKATPIPSEELPTGLNLKPTASLTVDVSRIAAMEAGAEKTYWLGKIEDFEKALYGVAADTSTSTPATESTLILPSEFPTYFPAYTAG